MAVHISIPKEIFAVDGARLSCCSAGIYPYKRADLTLIALVETANSVAAFTRNAFKAAPVIIAEKNIRAAQPRYLLINAGNANAGTGEHGRHAALQTCKTLAAHTGCEKEQILPFSTGVIGEYLPAERICAALPQLLATLQADGWLDAARAIMTTDTTPKVISKKACINGVELTLTGIAKGAGMIRPDMATMLSFIATDISIADAAIRPLFFSAIDSSFNCISVDGDTSSNDACLFTATGANKKLHIDSTRAAGYAEFAALLNELCITLAQNIIRDGEGASKFITIRIEQGKTEQQCKKIAYAIAESPLVKTAMTASDPNWGRLLVAIGKAASSGELARLDIDLNDVRIVEQGCRAATYTEQRGLAAMQQDEIMIRVDLHQGEHCAQIWSCDLSHEYISINTEYRS